MEGTSGGRRLTINIKQRLKALQYIDIKAKSKHQEIISLKSSILRGQQFNNMPKSKSNKNQSEELNVLIIDKSEQLYREIQELYQERDELVQVIESLDDPVENIIMRLLYIDGLSWSQIQAQLRCGRGTIHRARESALKKISKKWN
jgi:DNA-directed RNA polymerase specialized sigma24 family protein